MQNTTTKRIANKLSESIQALADSKGWTFLKTTFEIYKDYEILLPFLENKEDIAS